MNQDYNLREQDELPEIPPPPPPPYRHILPGAMGHRMPIMPRMNHGIPLMPGMRPRLNRRVEYPGTNMGMWYQGPIYPVMIRPSLGYGPMGFVMSNRPTRPDGGLAFSSPDFPPSMHNGTSHLRTMFIGGGRMPMLFPAPTSPCVLPVRPISRARIVEIIEPEPSEPDLDLVLVPADAEPDA